MFRRSAVIDVVDDYVFGTILNLGGRRGFKPRLPLRCVYFFDETLYLPADSGCNRLEFLHELRELGWEQRLRAIACHRVIWIVMHLQ